MDFVITEANKLAKKALNQRLLSFFTEARIKGENEERKLIFYFHRTLGIHLFNKFKEQILTKLREEYKKNKSYYEREGLIFYGIEAKNAREMRHKSKEELEILEKGIARLEKILEETRAKRKLK